MIKELKFKVEFMILIIQILPIREICYYINVRRKFGQVFMNYLKIS